MADMLTLSVSFIFFFIIKRICSQLKRQTLLSIAWEYIWLPVFGYWKYGPHSTAYSESLRQHERAETLKSFWFFAVLLSLNAFASATKVYPKYCDFAITSAVSARSLITLAFKPSSRNARANTASEALEKSFSSVESCGIDSGIVPICFISSINFFSLLINSVKLFDAISKFWEDSFVIFFSSVSNIVSYLFYWDI